MSEASKFTFEVPGDLRTQMQAHPEVNWSAVLREAIRRQLEAAELTRHIQREIDDPRVREIADMVRKGAAARFRKAVAEEKKRQQGRHDQ